MCIHGIVRVALHLQSAKTVCDTHEHTHTYSSRGSLESWKYRTAVLYSIHTERGVNEKKKTRKMIRTSHLFKSHNARHRTANSIDEDCALCACMCVCMHTRLAFPCFNMCQRECARWHVCPCICLRFGCVRCDTIFCLLQNCQCQAAAFEWRMDGLCDWEMDFNKYHSIWGRMNPQFVLFISYTKDLYLGSISMVFHVLTQEFGLVEYFGANRTREFPLVNAMQK